MWTAGMKSDMLEVIMDKDNRVPVKLTFETDELLELCIMAHEQDITLNTLINNILKEKLLDEELYALLHKMANRRAIRRRGRYPGRGRRLRRSNNRRGSKSLRRRHILR